jgi:hypothetical protein
MRSCQKEHAEETEQSRCVTDDDLTVASIYFFLECMREISSSYKNKIKLIDLFSKRKNSTKRIKLPLLECTKEKLSRELFEEKILKIKKVITKDNGTKLEKSISSATLKKKVTEYVNLFIDWELVKPHGDTRHRFYSIVTEDTITFEKPLIDLAFMQSIIIRFQDLHPGGFVRRDFR